MAFHVRIGFAGLVAALAGISAGNDVAVVVGVSDYKAPAVTDLKFADADARLFARTLIDSMGFRKGDVILLTSKPLAAERLSTASNILSALDEVGKRQANSTKSKFVFYFSGHGLSASDGPAIAAHDFHAPTRGALSAKALTSNISGRNVAFAWAVFDMCRPGSPLQASRASNNGFSLPVGKAKLVATTFSTIAGPSFESDELGHGYFTYYLSKAVTPKRSGSATIVPGLNGRGQVTLASMHDYARMEMLRATERLSGAGDGGPKESPTKDGPRPVAAIAAQRPDLLALGEAREVVLANFDPRFHQALVDPSDVAMMLKAKGIEAFDKGDFAKAATLLETAFETQPEVLMAINTGTAVFKRSGPEQAEVWYRKALAIDPKHSTALMHIAFVRHHQGQVEEAAEWYEKALASDPENVRALVNLGELMRRKRKHLEAERLFLRALAISSDHKMALYLLGSITKDLDKAEALYRRALAADPEMDLAMEGLADVYSSRGDLVNSERWFKAAIAANPKNLNAINKFGFLKEYPPGKPAEAEALYLQALAIDPNYWLTLQNLGTLRWRQGRLDEAEGLFRKLLAGDPKNVFGFFGMGRVTGSQGKFPEAEKWLLQVLDAEPAHVEAMIALGFAKSKQAKGLGDAWFVKALAISPDSESACMMLGGSKLDQGKHAEAEEWLRKAIALNEKRAFTHALLAKALLQQGKRDEAITSARRAIELGRKDDPIYKELGIKG